MKSMDGMLANVQLLDNIPVDLDVGKVLERLKLPNEKRRLKHMKLRIENKRFKEIARELIEIVAPVARPKALYKVACVTARGGDTVEIDGVKFTDRLLRALLDQVEEVFPSVSTCGKEVNAIQVASDDAVEQYCLNLIKRMVYTSANDYLQAHLREQYALGKIKRLNPPGELVVWPVVQFEEHFSLFGDVEGLIGVKVTDPYLKSPLKVPLPHMLWPLFSGTRISFPTETSFVRCLLCPEKCIGRRVPYDAAMVKRYTEMALLSGTGSTEHAAC